MKSWCNISIFITKFKLIICSEQIKLKVDWRISRFIYKKHAFILDPEISPFFQKEV